MSSDDSDGKSPVGSRISPGLPPVPLLRTGNDGNDGNDGRDDRGVSPPLTMLGSEFQKQQRRNEQDGSSTVETKQQQPPPQQPQPQQPPQQPPQHTTTFSRATRLPRRSSSDLGMTNKTNNVRGSRGARGARGSIGGMSSAGLMYTSDQSEYRGHRVDSGGGGVLRTLSAVSTVNKARQLRSSTYGIDVDALDALGISQGRSRMASSFAYDAPSRDIGRAIFDPSKERSKERRRRVSALGRGGARAKEERRRGSNRSVRSNSTST